MWSLQVGVASSSGCGQYKWVRHVVVGVAGSRGCGQCMFAVFLQPTGKKGNATCMSWIV